jgi:hypothetical protein
MRGDVVLADADNCDTGSIEIRFRRSERLPLDGATGRVVLGIDVDDQPLAGVIVQPHDLAILIGQREIREGRSNFNHGASF